LQWAGAQHVGQPTQRFGDQLRIFGIVVHRQPGQIDVN